MNEEICMMQTEFIKEKILNCELKVINASAISDIYVDCYANNIIFNIT